MIYTVLNGLMRVTCIKGVSYTTPNVNLKYWFFSELKCHYYFFALINMLL